MENNKTEIKNEKKQERIRQIKFLVFSLSAGVIQVLVKTFFTEVIPIAYEWSYIIALVCSVIWNFTLNRKYTFKSSNNIPIAMTKVGIYYAIFTPLSGWWTKLFTSQPYMWNSYWVLLVTMFINFVTEWLVQRYLVFGKSINTNNISQSKKKEIKEVVE